MTADGLVEPAPFPCSQRSKLTVGIGMLTGIAAQGVVHMQGLPIVSMQ